MSRSMNKLTAWQVATLETPGRHPDGGGLFLKVTAEGLRSWVFIAPRLVDQPEIELGGSSSVSLETARRLAGEMRHAIAAGENPRIVPWPDDPKEPITIPTFGDFAESYISDLESGWKNPRHQQHWRNSLRTHAKMLSGMPVDQIGIDDVVAVLGPIWQRIPNTAVRVRARIEKILDAAGARGFRFQDGTNPAAKHDDLVRLFPAPPKLTRGHHPALPWTEAPSFMAELRDRQALAARCLEFLILTAARRGEALGATWGEIDIEARLWSIPAARTASGNGHVVPLSTAVIASLKELSPERLNPDVFVFAVNSVPLSDRAISMLLRRMKRDGITAHGFRTAFRDWAEKCINCPPEILDHALAHSISNGDGPTSIRSDMIKAHRELMEAWSEFLILAELFGTADENATAIP